MMAIQCSIEGRREHAYNWQQSKRALKIDVSFALDFKQTKRQITHFIQIIAFTYVYT